MLKKERTDRNVPHCPHMKVADVASRDGVLPEHEAPPSSPTANMCSLVHIDFISVKDLILNEQDVM